MKLKIYYAHCKAIYNTPQEDRDTSLLESLGFEIINPNTKAIQEECKGQIEYFRKFAKECDAIIFRALPNGKIPQGVYKEIQMFKDEDKPVLEFPSGILTRELSLAETREFLMEIGNR